MDPEALGCVLGCSIHSAQLTSIIHQHIRAAATLVLYMLETSLNLAGVRKVSSVVFNKFGSKFLAVL